jgi:UDP-N-acetylglucosamine 2-epimerase
VNNLLKEGITRKKIFLTGHPLVDLLNQIRGEIRMPKIKENGLSLRDYYVITLHRDFNTDNKDRLKQILLALGEIAKSRPVVFPVHPRTKKKITKFGLEDLLSTIIATDPVGYTEMLGLIKDARAVLTDSGGIQQEAPLLGTPCITLRENTEWIETLAASVNVLVGASFGKIIRAVSRLDKDYSKTLYGVRHKKDIFGQKGSFSRILDVITEFIKN